MIGVTLYPHMHIRLLYFKGCPNYLDAFDALKQAAQSLGMQRDVQIEMQEIKTQAEAEQSKFVGSPTFMINDRDLFGEPNDATYGLRCRIYLLNGQAVGLPSVADFAAKLRKLTDRPRPQSQPR
ncbi:MAG: thioredoxin family protein [bacterium]|nr:thioredoxin family protein [bacterium]